MSSGVIKRSKVVGCGGGAVWNLTPQLGCKAYVKTSQTSQLACSELACSENKQKFGCSMEVKRIIVAGVVASTDRRLNPGGLSAEMQQQHMPISIPTRV
jgi:hypothetical protein